MANYCSMTVSVDGKVSDVLAFGKSLVGYREDYGNSIKTLTMTNILPVDRTSKDTSKWKHKNWGVLRDINIDSVDIEKYKDTLARLERLSEDNMITLEWDMSCDWTYPDEFFKYATEKFKGITITVEAEESGVDLYRVSQFKDGVEEIVFDTSNRFLFELYTGADLEYVMEDFVQGEKDLDYHLEDEYKIENLAEMIIEYGKSDTDGLLHACMICFCRMTSTDDNTVTIKDVKPLIAAIKESIEYKKEDLNESTR